MLSGGIPRINSTFDIKAKDVASLVALTGWPGRCRQATGLVAFAGTAQSGADDLTYDVNLDRRVGGTGKLAGKVTRYSRRPRSTPHWISRPASRRRCFQLVGLAGTQSPGDGSVVAGTLKGGADDMNSTSTFRHRRHGEGSWQHWRGWPIRWPSIFHPGQSSGIHPPFCHGGLAEFRRWRALAVTAKAAGTTKQAKVSQLDAKWGDSSLTGTADYDASSGRPYIRANIAGGTVNLAPFMGPAAKRQWRRRRRGGQGRRRIPWSEEPLDLGLDKQDADIDFQANSPSCPTSGSTISPPRSS